MKCILGGVLLAAVITSAAYAAPVPGPTIQAISATLAGQPGTVVGWGLTLTYTAPSDWVVLNDSFFTGTPVYGTYKDYIATEFIVAGPAPESSVITVPFSRPATGLGEFDINRTAAYVSVTGNIVVDYSVFSQDPNSPAFDPNSFVAAGQVTTPVAIDIVPEPETIGLFLFASGGLVVLRRILSRL